MITRHVGLIVKQTLTRIQIHIDTPAYCISDQNNLHKHLHCRQDILQRNFSFQNNLHPKTQVFDFRIIHFLESRARRGGHEPA